MGLFVQLFQRIPNTILFMQIRFVFIFIYEYDICPLFDSSFFLSLFLSLVPQCRPPIPQLG